MWRNWTELYGILIWASWVKFPDEKKEKKRVNSVDFLWLLLFLPEILFCFGSKIRRNVQESSVLGKFVFDAKTSSLWDSAGSDPENLDSGGQETCQLYGFLLFCCRNCKNNTKINRKKGGVGGAPSAILYIRAWSRWGFTILSRLNLFSVPCSPVFPV